jgi:hypothetical protein
MSIAACSPSAERVLSDVDIVVLVLSVLLGDRCGGETATRAARSLCLASKVVRAAVLASLQRARMDRLLAVLQQMVSLASLSVAPGPLDPS